MRLIEKIKRRFKYLLSGLCFSGRGRITAMIRVKNGEEFLAASILSILDHVDDVVIINNNSNDATSIIGQRLAELSDKVNLVDYPYDIIPIGETYQQVAAENPNSPHLTSTFYNFCLTKCHGQFVMKWDDDMIALANFERLVKEFRESRCLQLDFGGENLSADMSHFLKWKAGIEPRIFPLCFSKFLSGEYGFVGKPGEFGGEYINTFVSDTRKVTIHEQVYAHLKYCKKDPISNQSKRFSESLARHLTNREPSFPEVSSQINYWLAKAKDLGLTPTNQ
ncbi:MAG: glycosyltransferase [Verrucomicrobiae bacterium]|nr:glycosyltransferase [Verrucomicrobiae bacterium]NNJ44022.1 glycosyltransferase [Akkermansiaceae bacterium]